MPMIPVLFISEKRNISNIDFKNPTVINGYDEFILSD